MEGGERERKEEEESEEHVERERERERVSREMGRRIEKKGGKELYNNIQNRYCMHAAIRAATTVRPPVCKPRSCCDESLLQREGDLLLPVWPSTGRRMWYARAQGRGGRGEREGRGGR